MENLHCFLVFSTIPNRVTEIREDLNVYINEIVNIMDRFDCERAANIYLDSSNAERFFDELDTVLELHDMIGTLTITETVKFLLSEIQPIYWDRSRSHDEHEEHNFYRQFDSLSRSIIEPCPIYLKEVSERIFLKNEGAVENSVIVNPLGDIAEMGLLSVIRGSDGQDPIIFNIRVLRNFLEIDDWIFSHIRPRNYNNNDNRHIEKHPDYRKGKSPLLGGLPGKVQAAKLLKDALGAHRERLYLINYDSSRQRFIRFEYEGNNEQNQYHGYHLALPQSHEIDCEAIEQIPSKVLRLLRYRAHLRNLPFPIN